MEQTIYQVDLKFEHDVVQARQRAREIASLLGFDHQEQIRLATATSEIARNAFRYAKSGKVEFSVRTDPHEFLISVSDKGPGISNLDEILEGRYKSGTGLGKGILGTKRLMDRFSIEAKPQGTRVLLGKQLPKGAPPPISSRLRSIVEELNRRRPENPFQEIEQQNQELLKTLAELRSRQEELFQLNEELKDTNRGVVALYAELDERADALRRISDAKTSFLSNMSHEFRTPLNSILSLSRMLLEKEDGDLNAEQEKQAKYIQKATQDLCEMVNDLLDLAKVEAGKAEVNSRDFEVADLFGALRGMLKPLLLETSVSLVFEDAGNLPTMHSDEGKVSQILRNFISNALKFTSRGEIRISAKPGDNGTMVFSVADTGIGIAPHDQIRIFDEFAQIDHPIQRKVKGTGLGLPLSRNLAQLLGGSVTLNSRLGLGSTFSVIIPIVYPGTPEESLHPIAPPIEPRLVPLLLVEDNRETSFLLRKYLENTEFQVIPAHSFDETRKLLAQFKPALVILDVMLQGESSWPIIHEVRSLHQDFSIPILAISVTSEVSKALEMSANSFLRKPLDRDILIKEIRKLTNRQAAKLLLIDDDEVSRYLLREHISPSKFQVYEARTGAEGIRLAQAEAPDAIILDLLMPDISGFEVLGELRNDPRTRGIPIVIHSSQLLSDADRKKLDHPPVYIFPKSIMQATDAGRQLQDMLGSALAQEQGGQHA